MCETTMPFSGHTPENLKRTLDNIINSELRIELFDAFLSKYKKTGDLNKAISFARCEWDC